MKAKTILTEANGGNGDSVLSVLFCSNPFEIFGSAVARPCAATSRVEPPAIYAISRAGFVSISHAGGQEVPAESLGAPHSAPGAVWISPDAQTQFEQVYRPLTAGQISVVIGQLLPDRMMTGTMLKVCCKCHVVMLTKPCLPQCAGVSDGICDACNEKYFPKEAA